MGAVNRTNEAVLWAAVEALPLTPWSSDRPPQPGAYLTTRQAGMVDSLRPNGYPVWSFWTGETWGWAVPHPEAAAGRMTLLDKPASQEKYWRGLIRELDFLTLAPLYSQLYLPRA